VQLRKATIMHLRTNREQTTSMKGMSKETFDPVKHYQLCKARKLKKFHPATIYYTTWSTSQKAYAKSSQQGSVSKDS
jgi:hypothetical protein